MHGMGELQVMGQHTASFASEVDSNTSGGTIYIPCHCQLEGVVLIPAVTLDNAVTNASAYVVAKKSGAAYATETTLATINPWEDETFAQGNGTRAGVTSFDYSSSISTGWAVVKQINPPKQLRAGDVLYVRGGTTAPSATGDWYAQFLVRVGGPDMTATTVLSPLNSTAAVDS